jgi:hypothetical protein
MRRLAPAVVVLVALTACAAATPAWTPDTADAVIRPASMVVDRDTVSPDEILEITFPEEDVVGIAYVLEQEVGEAWVYRYLLLAPEGDGMPAWYLPEDVTFEIPAIGISDPVRVLVPMATEPGTWRICTVASAENVCVRIEVVQRGSAWNPAGADGVSAA